MTSDPETPAPPTSAGGGKGVATAAGAVLGSHPLWAPVVLLVWVVVLAATRWIALTSVAAGLSLLLVALVLRAYVAVTPATADAAVDKSFPIPKPASSTGCFPSTTRRRSVPVCS